MASLRGILQEHIATSEKITLGGGSSKKINRNGLVIDLQQNKKRNEKYFKIGIGMLLVLFVLMILVTLKQLNNPDTIKGVMAAFGGSVTLLVSKMFKVYKEKNLTDLALSFAMNGDEEMLKAAAEALFKHL